MAPSDNTAGDQGQRSHAVEIARPSPPEVDRVVTAIIGSGVLGKSDRRAALLRYLVDLELSGRGAEIKAFVIAVDVLGRDQSFDPASDSIVRSEIGRLRDALRLYFAEMAPRDQLRIDIPKGSYRPVFSSLPEQLQSPPIRPQKARRAIGLVVLLSCAVLIAMSLFGWPVRQTAQTGDGRPSSELPYDPLRIVVAPAQWVGDDPRYETFAHGFRAELMMDLSAYPWMSVVSPVADFASLDPDQIDFVLDVDVDWNDNTIHAYARLITLPDQGLVWSNTQFISTETTAMRRAVGDLASQIAIRLGASRGIAPALTKAKITSDAPENLEAFLCYLGVHRYLEVPTDQAHLHLRDCLSEAVTTFPSFGDGWAALALIHIDEARFGSNARPGADAWADAEAAIEQASRFSPIRMLTLNMALVHSIEAPQQNLAEFDRLSALLLELYPRHPSTLYNVGSRMAEFAGAWDEGLFLVDQAIALNPSPPSAYHLTRAYHVAMQGTEEELLQAVRPLTATTATSQLLLNYLAVGGNMLTDETLKYRDLMKALGLVTDEDIVRHIKGRRYVASLETALLAQLDSVFQANASQ
ncbi:hypothetical protein [Roseobacter weihaiensis]|uniref:hypothetical protein n=1 Tax=Roseobacter weihaiensis TaxID=2763262 RepID=UPI001D0B74F7|nr:hypothetical protein [Roseobacter sp. H9]